MPEGPELCMNSRFVNNVCKGQVFAGKVLKSAVSKCAEVDFSSEAYVISSESRGKELALTLQCTVRPLNTLRLLFRFGMSGKFRFTPLDGVPKHAHLQFFSRESPAHVLSFVDVRRFGSWHVIPEGWGENRGPDPMFDYAAFRRYILENLQDSAFNRPICEALLNQKYFNGIGNYLRAEILFRAGVPPFTCARKVLEKLSEMDSGEDLLSLCHSVPLEVINLKQKEERMVITEDDYRVFCQWLRCYENPEMNTARDHNGRTIWFKGEAGSMCSKSQQSRGQRKKRQRVPGGPPRNKDTLKTENTEDDEEYKARDEVIEVVAVKVKKERFVEDDGSPMDSQDKKSRRQKKEKSHGQPEVKRAKWSHSDGEAAERKRRASKRDVKKKTTVLPSRRSARLKMKETADVKR